MMMPFKIFQSKETDLQKLPMMLEITLLTTSNSDRGSVEWQNDCA